MTAKTPEPSPEPRPASAASSTPSVPAQPAKASAIPPEKPTSAEAAPAGAAESADPAERAEPAEPTTAATVPTKPTSAAKTPEQTPAAKVPAAKVPAKVPARPATATLTARPRRSNGSGGAATVAAVLSLLFSIGASAVAVYALDVAREAKSRATIAMGADEAAGQAPAGPTAPPVSTPSPSPTATPGPVYVAEIQQVQVQIPAAVGCASVYFDVDALRIGVEAGHEFYLSSCVGPLAFRADRVSGVAAARSVSTPQDCLDRIARSPSLAETVLPVETGMVVCLLTSAQAAQQQGIPQKVGIVEVRAINADRSVTVAVSTYRVPT